MKDPTQQFIEEDIDYNKILEIPEEVLIKVATFVKENVDLMNDVLGTSLHTFKDVIWSLSQHPNKEKYPEAYEERKTKAERAMKLYKAFLEIDKYKVANL